MRFTSQAKKKSVILSLYISEVGGCSTGESFRFVRACVRAVWLSSGIGSKNVWAGLFPKLSGNENGLWSLCILRRSNLADFQETLW